MCMTATLVTRPVSAGLFGFASWLPAADQEGQEHKADLTVLVADGVEDEVVAFLAAGLARPLVVLVASIAISAFSVTAETSASRMNSSRAAFVSRHAR